MNEIWLWVTQNFNNREIAAAAWIVLILGLVSIKKDVRSSMFGVVRAVAGGKLLIVFGAFAGWISLLSWLASLTGLWTSNQGVPTVVWYFFGGLPLLFRAFDAKEGTQHFRGYALAVLSGTALIEFIYVARTFSLSIELILTPIVTFIALLAVVSERNPEHAAVNKLLTWILAIAAFTTLWHSVSQIWAKPETFFTIETARSFILPIYLTIFSIPFFYALHCYSHIEGVRIQIDLKTFQSDELKAYAKKRFILTFMARPWLLRRATRQFHIMPARVTADVDKIIQDILHYKRQEENPPEVDDLEGWSPFSAREFLADEGLRTNDYHAGGDGDEWWSGVAARGLDEGILPSIGNYSFSGVDGVVKQLRFRGHFVDDYITGEALDEFSRLAWKLCKKALKGNLAVIREQLARREPFEMIVGATKVRLRLDRFSSEKGFELTLFLMRSRPLVSLHTQNAASERGV
ncbi:hypothetical protein [Oleiagrimonas sp. C23AA]|uniref:hypothetical protein n=1 Tax=Oleiagrimonas sp. C23AA TaxID=2719047 RepID=UPI00141EB368|nr:hypothetical protein [Oleiagrimonas sp. C23AA]NII10297.1 hypothetical protein [Oleiagrimonas sp. C23AA]